MAIKQGTYGLVMTGPADPAASVIASLQNWSLDHNRESFDTTVLGATDYRTNVTTFASWNVQCEGFWDDADTDGQIAVEAAMIANTPVYVKLYPSADSSGTPASGDVFYAGIANVSSYSSGGSYDNAATASITLEGTGALTRGVVA